MVVDGLDLVRFATLAFAGGSSVLGLLIAYFAYRGLRRHDSRQMLYLSAGMILLFGVAYAVAALGSVLFHYWLLPLPYQDPFRLVVRVVQFAGLVLIAQSLRLGRRSPDRTGGAERQSAE